MFSVRPLTDRNLVEQLVVCGTCVFPLGWRVSDHNTASLSISHSQTLQQKVWTGRALCNDAAKSKQRVVQARIGLRI